MSNFWNKDGLVVGKIISDDIVSSSGEKFVKESEIKSSGGHALGEQWISFDGTIPDGGLPFDGQLRNIELYQQLFDWAKENDRVISETEWQQIRETNNGNVPYYSFGDGTSGQKRVIEVQFNTNNLTDTVGFSMGVDGEASIATSGTVEEIIAMINRGELGDNRFTADYEITDVAPYAVEPPLLGTVLTLIITAKECSDFDNNYVVGGPSVSSIIDAEDGVSPRESTTFRLPIFNSYFKADVVGGEYIAEGLPNITGEVGTIAGAESVGTNTGAFAHAGTTDVNITNGGDSDYKASFDASRCSTIYGNSEHVTPETSTVIVGVWAVGSYTNVANIDMSDIKEAINVASTYDSMPLLMSHWDTKGFVSAGWVRADGYWLDGNLYKDAYDKILQLETAVHSNYVTTLDASNPFNFLVDTTNVKFRLPFLKEGNKVVIKELGTYADDLHKTVFFGDGTIEISGLHTCTTDKATITWETPVNINYKLFLTDTDKNSTGSDTDGYTAYAGPAAYSETSFYVSLYKSSNRLIQWVLEGTPVNYIVPETSFLYFKLGNTFINEDQMDANYLATKIDTVYNSWQDADYVVESYSNGTEWYRLYKSGWLEQGGKNKSGSSVTVSLHLPFIDTNYNLQLSFYGNSNGYPPCIREKTTTSFAIYSGGAATKAGDWYACGF